MSSPPESGTTREPLTPRRKRRDTVIGVMVIGGLAPTGMLLLLVGYFGLPWNWPFDGSGLLWDFGNTEGTPISELERAARTEARVQATIALAQLLTVFALLVAAAAAILSYRQTHRESQQTQANAQKQFELARQAQELATKGQVTERFTRAIEQLGAVAPNGNKAWELRLGGIYALEQIANDNPDEYYGPVMEVLTAYVRGHAPAPEPSDGGEGPKPSRPSIEVQAILTVIGRRSERLLARKNVPIDLSKTNLKGAGMSTAHLDGANLIEAHLEGANLIEAHLEGAFLFDAHLEDATLIRAHLKDAKLHRAHLEVANLRQAQMEDANLREAQMEGANLREAHLEGADLSWATGLTQDRLNESFMDETTRIPEGLERSTRLPLEPVP